MLSSQVVSHIFEAGLNMCWVSSMYNLTHQPFLSRLPHRQSLVHILKPLESVSKKAFERILGFFWIPLSVAAFNMLRSGSSGNKNFHRIGIIFQFIYLYKMILFTLHCKVRFQMFSGELQNTLMHFYVVYLVDLNLQFC